MFPLSHGGSTRPGALFTLKSVRVFWPTRPGALFTLKSVRVLPFCLPLEKVLVPGGPFVMGTNLEPPYPGDGEGPARLVVVNDFWLDEAEVPC